jgi:hypothetical protein
VPQQDAVVDADLEHATVSPIEYLRGFRKFGELPSVGSYLEIGERGSDCRITADLDFPRGIADNMKSDGMFGIDVASRVVVRSGDGGIHRDSSDIALGASQLERLVRQHFPACSYDDGMLDRESGYREHEEDARNPDPSSAEAPTTVHSLHLLRNSMMRALLGLFLNREIARRCAEAR